MANNPQTPLVKRFLSLLVVVALIAVGVREGLFYYHHVHEANAQVQANFTVLSSSVNGTLAKVLARRGDPVERGQLLATMDSREAELEIASLEAELARQRAAKTEVRAELEFFLSELDDRIETASAATALLARSFETANNRMVIARKNVERNSKLESRSVIARQRVDDANDRLLEMTERVRELESDMKMSDMKLAELRGQRKRESVYQSRIAMIDREVEQTAVKLTLAKKQLEDMNVKSPLTGVLNRVYVNPGTYVEDGEPLLLLHDPTDLWIEAQVAESDIRLVSVGQTVLIELDAYPFEQFSGTVEAIGRVTTGQMSGPQNRDADITAQRIAVDIAMPDVGRPVWPGMRAAVNIVVR